MPILPKKIFRTYRVVYSVKAFNYFFKVVSTFSVIVFVFQKFRDTHTHIQKDL